MFRPADDRKERVENGVRFRFSRHTGLKKQKNTMGSPSLTEAPTGGDAAFVEFDHVQKSYDGENLVVKDLNLSIAKGEFLTMLGPSGSGKTTCLMMLAGFETATLV